MIKALLVITGAAMVAAICVVLSTSASQSSVRPCQWTFATTLQHSRTCDSHTDPWHVRYERVLRACVDQLTFGIDKNTMVCVRWPRHGD